MWRSPPRRWRLRRSAVAAAAGVGNSGDSSGQAANGSGYEPSETDRVNVAQQPGRYAPDELSVCGVNAPMGGYRYDEPRG